MFSHVVMFRWSEQSTPEERADALAGLTAFAADVSDLGTLRVGADAGLAGGNFDVVVVADFPDRETYLRYAADPRHTAMIARYIRPILAARVAVQGELG